MKLNSAALRDAFSACAKVFNRYALLWFVLLLAGVYGFVALQIYLAHGIQPSDATIASKEQALVTPHIDQSAANQLLTLQDHNVNVKTLFDQARKNPFHE